MTKKPVTPEMIERARVSVCRSGRVVGSFNCGPGCLDCNRVARNALEAALSEPEEIPVSPGMIEAAIDLHNAEQKAPMRSYGRSEWFAMVYRAMRKIEIEEEGAARAPCGAERYERSAPGCGWTVFNERSGRGRRKDDGGTLEDSSKYFGGNPYEGNGTWCHLRRGERGSDIQYHRRKDDK